MFAEDEAALLREAATDDDDLSTMLDSRLDGMPLEMVLGWAEFSGLRIRVAPGVFVPRLRTSFLVETAREHLAARLNAAPTVLDLCCGTGAAGAALQRAVPRAAVYAADIDPRAVACARDNLTHSDHVFEGDLFGALPESLRGGFDVILANAPYVPTEEIAFMPQEARLHEPLTALDGGSDGLRIQARVASEAGAWLQPGGMILIETSVRQASATKALLDAAGLQTRVRHSDDLDATLVAGVDLTQHGPPHLDS